MTSNSLRYLLIVALSLSGTACATASAGTQWAASDSPASDAAAVEFGTPMTALTPEENSGKPLTTQQRTEVQLHVMTGELAAGRKQPETAAREFLQALAIVDDAELAQRATSMALAARNEKLAMQAAKRWQELAPNEAEPREVIARLALNMGDLDEAYGQCAIIIGGSAGGPEDGFRQVTQILSFAGKQQAEAALTLMQRLVSKWPQLSQAQQALGLLALRYDNLTLADFAARRALSLDPESREVQLLIVGVRVRQGNFEESDAIIETLSKSGKGHSELRLGYAKLLLEAGERERARTQLNKLLASDSKNADARYALGVLAYNDRKLDEAIQDFEALLGSPRASEAAFQLGRIEELRNNYPKALTNYEMVTTGPQALDALVRRAYVLTKTGKTKDAQELMQSLREQFPQLAERFYLAEAEMLSDAALFTEALDVYEVAFAETQDNVELLYGRSLVYERQNRIELAEKDLRAILKQDADDARAMNALGYMLTVHTQRLKEASKLITRAHELQPDDAAIMDSLGWVQYKLGDKAAARELLSKALEKYPDAEIAAHLGEVLWVMGEKDQARQVWNKALASDPDHRLLTETVQRYDATAPKQ